MLDAIINGLLLGGLYTVVALGLSLVFGVMRLVNLAHGELVIAGAYVAFLVTRTFGLDPLVSLVIVTPVMFLIAYPIQRFLFTPLLQRSGESALVATVGVSILAQSLFLLGFSANAKAFTTEYATSGLEVATINVRVVYLIAVGVSVALVFATQHMLTRTAFGRALRAAASDPDTTATMGVNVNHVYATTFGIAAAMAAIGGVLVGLAFSFTPTVGAQYLLKGITVVVLGGIGNVYGTLAGGLFIGLVESLASYTLGGVARDMVVLVLFVILLAVRPQGFFGRRL